MEKWKETEERGYQWILEKFPDAIRYGESDSTHSDVFIPSLNSFIEIKDLTNGCRCGQFTAATAIGDYCKRIIEGTYSEEDIKNFVRNHYGNKKVSQFLIYFNENFQLLGTEEFLNKFTFSIQSYKKRSGTRKVPKKDIDKVLDYDSSFSLIEGAVYCSNSLLYDSYFDIEDNQYYINKLGEVRKRGNTNNQTWLVEVY
jgi:hypothetical protein